MKLQSFKRTLQDTLASTSKHYDRRLVAYPPRLRQTYSCRPSPSSDMKGNDSGHPAWSLLAQAIDRATEGSQFNSEEFFPIWFRESGTPYFFLFKKNLSVTNIQLPELLALIRQHIFSKDTGCHVTDVAFHTNAAFTQVLDDIVCPIVKSVHFTPSAISSICALYWPIIEKSIVVDTFFTSCAVFLPPHLDIDLLTICAESGYIHSCGYSLFVRRMSKATQSDFYDAIDRHLEKYPTFNGTLQFIPFSAEDFDDDKRIGYVKDALQDGLEGTKIKVEKHEMTKVPLVHIFQDMLTRYDGRLLFRGAGPYKHKHPQTSDSTLWLIADSSVNRNNPVVAGGDKYYICYHQIYFNDSPFHLFDENKPAWVAHTTMPHTLLAAMINITKPWPGDSQTIVGDPFGGTGTTWLESLNHADAQCVSGDINPLFPILTADNAMFFAMPKMDLLQNVADLEQLITRLGSQTDVLIEEAHKQRLLIDTDDPQFPPAYKRAVERVERLRAGKKAPFLSFVFPLEVARELAQTTFFERLVFYITLRAELRYQSAYARGTPRPTSAFIESAKYLVDEMRSLYDWCSRAAIECATVGRFSVFSGHYSKACSIRYACLRQAVADLPGGNTLRVRDARHIEKQSYDIIVTDPPYGFNTEEELFPLAQLYSEVITALLAAIRNNGHLVICLPDEAFTGRSLPVCAKSQIVTEQILRSADSLGRELFVPARSNLPMTAAPYYWKSPALRRTVLHFRVRDRAVAASTH